jgi:hypothetical protein
MGDLQTTDITSRLLRDKILTLLKRCLNGFGSFRQTNPLLRFFPDKYKPALKTSRKKKLMITDMDNCS